MDTSTPDKQPRANAGFTAAGSSGGAARASADLGSSMQGGPPGFWELNLDTNELFSSSVCKGNFGLNAGEPLTYEILTQAIHPDDLNRQQSAIRAAIETSAPLDVECRVRWPDDSIHCLRMCGHAICDAAGKPLRIAGISFDVTEGKETEQSLRDDSRTLETLNRVGVALAGNLDLDKIVQTATDVATELSGAQFGAFFYGVSNDQGESHTLHAVSGVAREAFSKLSMPCNAGEFSRAFSSNGIVRSNDIHVDPRFGQNKSPSDGQKVASYLAVPVISRSGEVLGGLFFGHASKGVFSERAERIVAGIAAQAASAIDNARLFQEAQYEIAERKRVEQHQKLLLAELNHRVRNTLAIVQSIAGQTLRHASSAENFRARFEERIMALSEAHALLTDSNWEGASVLVIINRVLGPYSDEGNLRHEIEAAEDVRIGPSAAVTLVMALHELATNAVKYGALSRASGKLHLSCKPHQVPDAMRRLRVRWQETGGPKVKAPTRTGFGSRLIRSLAAEAGGEAKIDFAETGLVCEFDLPYPTDIIGV